MSATAATTAVRGLPQAGTGQFADDPARQAFMLLRVGFAVAPIAFGLDKFAELLVGGAD